MLKFRLLVLTITAALLTIALSAQDKAPKSNESSRYGVASEQLDAKQLGVAIYPGARVQKKNNDGKGANLSFDWGDTGAHLYAQTYITSDPPEKVLAFYRKQLAKYGNVLECRGSGADVSVNSELKCDNDKHDGKGVELKAGTENSQHIVGVTPKEDGTEIGIVYLKKHGSM